MLIVISGGSQGLGYALAELYLERGAKVIIVARREKVLQKAVEALKESVPDAQVSYQVADAQNPQDCERVFKGLDGVADLVFCCAGAAKPGIFIEKTAEELKTETSTVYDTAMFFSHAALRSMAAAKDKAQKQRHIVYVSSIVAIFSFYGYSTYAPAKAAIRALSDAVRHEAIAHNVRVTHVIPGSMDTEGYKQEEFYKPAITKVIEGPSPAADPRDIARQVVRDMDRGNDTIYTDFIGWVLGSMMLGLSPRHGILGGIFQTLFGMIMALVGAVARFKIISDVKSGLKKEAKVVVQE